MAITIDTKFWQSFQTAVDRLWSKAWWLSWTGVVMLSLASYFLVASAYQTYMCYKMHALPKGNTHTVEYLKEQFALVKEEYLDDEEAEKDGDLLHMLFYSKNDKHAVIFGMQQTVKTILMCNMIVSAMFMLQGLRMIQVARQTLIVCQTLRASDIEEGPEKLNELGIKPQRPKDVHAKIRWFYILISFTIAILLFSFVLRILVTYKSLEQERHLVQTLRQVLKQKQPEGSGSRVRQNSIDSSLTWNYIRVVENRDDTDLEQLQVLTDTDLEETENDYPLAWFMIYLVLLIFLARKNMKDFFAFGMRQEVMAKLLADFNFAKANNLA